MRAGAARYRWVRADGSPITDEAEALIKAGVRYIAEGSNMGCTAEAIEVFEASRKGVSSLQDKGVCWYASGKQANLGGVAVSGVSGSPERLPRVLLTPSMCSSRWRKTRPGSSGPRRSWMPSSRTSWPSAVSLASTLSDASAHY